MKKLNKLLMYKGRLSVVYVLISFILVLVQHSTVSSHIKCQKKAKIVTYHRNYFVFAIRRVLVRRARPTEGC